jgi:hypothetical protein
VKPTEQGCSHTTDVKHAGGAWGKSGNDHRARMLPPCMGVAPSHARPINFVPSQVGG